MKIKRIMIYLLVLTMMLTSLPVNMLTGAAQEISFIEESDAVQSVEVQEEFEEDLPEDCIVEEVIEFEEAEVGVSEFAEQELETETEVYPEIMIEEMIEVNAAEVYNTAAIASGSCGENVNWELDASLNLVISGEGAMKDYKDCDGTDRAPWLDYLDTNFTLNSVTVESGITRIGANAFGWCWINSTSMQLPDTLVEIGESAFRGCNNLSQILIPDSVTKIEDYAFAGTDLVTVVVPDSVISIGERVLGECFSLVSVKLPAGMTEIPAETFVSCWELKDIEIPSGVTKIGDQAFSGCKSITDLQLPDGLTMIGNGSFGNCAGLRNLCIPANVTRIGDQAFFYITRFNGVDYGEIEIRFMGNMPVFEGTRVFTGAQGTLCYLSGTSDTWTADLSSYGLDANIMSVCSFGSGTCGSNVTWSLGTGGVLTISGTGAMADYDSYSDQPWRDYAEYINKIVINDGVTAVGENSFVSLLNLKEVSLPNTLERIGYQAFWGCKGLIDVVLPESLKRLEDQAFAYCESVTEFVIPEGVVGEDGYLGGCLDGCVSLTSVALPGNLKVIPDYMFLECSALETIEFPNALTTIGVHAFEGCINLKEIIIPSSVTQICEGAFYGCTGLKTVSDLANVTEIGAYAFYACEALDKVQFPEGITCLEAYVLSRCSSLTVFMIPESVNTIGEGAFATSGLQNITIPESVTEIGAAAFWQCKNLSEVTFEGDLPVFKSLRTVGTTSGDTIYPFQDLTIDCYYPLGGAGWSRTQPADCGGTLTMVPYGVVSGYLERDGEKYVQWRLRADGEFVLSGTGDIQDFGSEDDYDAEGRPWYKYKDLIKRVTIGSGITSIGSKAFYECENLTEIAFSNTITRIRESAFELSGLISVVIPDSVKEIDKYAFMTCENLRSVNLGTGIEEIGDCAFAECSSLSSITIPASVKVIGASAFRYSGLKAVLFIGDLPKIGTNAFSTIPACNGGIQVEYPADNESWAGVTQSSLGGSSDGGVFEFGEHVHSWGNGAQTTAPTCTAAGVKTYNCSICGKTKTEAIGVKGHSWNGGVQTTAPTCTATGVKTYTCSNCGGTKKESMNSLGHNAGSWTTAKAATCTGEGTKEKRCTRCKTVLSTEKLAAKGHDWNGWKVCAAATVFAAQQEERTCSVCKLTEKKSTGSKLEAQIKLNYNNIPLQVGQSTTKIEVSGLADGDSVKSWKSNKTKIATVNSKGKITGKKAGTAEITVTLASGLSETITVKVQKKAVKTTAIWIVGYSDFTLQKGGKFDLAASMKPYVTPVTSLEKITYSSSNEKILKVNSKGVVTAVGAGKAKIIIKSGKIKEYATFTVPKAKTAGISNVPEKISLKRLKKYTIKAKLNPTNSDEKITYKSSNKKVATVTDKGVIKTWMKGTAKITVKSGSVKKVIKVTVKK